MKPFTQHSGVAAPLIRINIDTDAIIPSREMKSVTKRGLSGGLFAGWRYTAPNSRELNPEFVLNQAAYANCSIILAGANFGCGSSREHAVWALAEYGIRCIIAPSFGSIFYNNCVRNGLLPVVLSEENISHLAAQIKSDPQQQQIRIDLQQNKLSTTTGTSLAFELEESHRQMLLLGLDPIGLTLQKRAVIAAKIKQDRLARSWAYLSE